MKKFSQLLVLAYLLLGFGCQPSNEGMLKIIILYPNEEGNQFDLDYYSQNHVPMVAYLLGDALKSYEIDTGIGGRGPNDPAPYIAICYLYVESMEAYQEAFDPVAEKIRGDISNYTNIRPIIQVSKVVQ